MNNFTIIDPRNFPSLWKATAIQVTANNITGELEIVPRKYVLKPRIVKTYTGGRLLIPWEQENEAADFTVKFKDYEEMEAWMKSVYALADQYPFEDAFSVGHTTYFRGFQ